MYLGIEIGGTKLQLALGPGDGTLSAIRRTRVDASRGAAGIRSQIDSILPEIVTTPLQAVGIGFGGPVDDAGNTLRSHQIDGWDRFPLTDWISQRVKAPTRLGNDADVAGLGEALFGAGQGLSPLFYVTIGSGVGGGLIVNGRIFRGMGLGAAEIGHLRLSSGDILEHTVSGWAIERRAAGKYANVAAIGKAALAGDEVAERLLDEARRALAEGLCHVIALINPRRIVLGGGVSLLDDRVWLDPIRSLVADRVFKPFANGYDIVSARLGEEVVLHGAIALAKGA